MNNLTKQQIIKNISKSISLSPKEETLFLSLLSSRSFQKKGEILSIGDTCKNQNYVLSGCLKIFYLNDQGQEHIVKFAIEDWWAFDIESFIEATPAYYGITSLENTEILQLSRSAYDKLLQAIPAFEKFYRLMFQNSFIALQYRITQSLSLPAYERYERFKVKYPGLESRISQRNIASYLGITPVFLSMLRKEELQKH